MKILCIGDIVGDKGVNKVVEYIRKNSFYDCIIANIENSSQKGGRGFSEYAYNLLSVEGVKIFTGGNHSFDNKFSYHLYNNKNLLRPCNFPSETIGKGHVQIDITKKDIVCSLVVINVQLRVFMREHLGCPFRAVESILSYYKGTNSIIIVDLHGEATAEKLSFTSFFDGKVSAIFGTHTHVQTADERIFPKGTGYITDVGMVGALNSSLGIKFEKTIYNFLNQMPIVFEIEEDGEFIFSGIVFEIDEKSKKCISVKRIYEVI
jgi:metallophosphoesterase (TIGR00282 family)